MEDSIALLSQHCLKTLELVERLDQNIGDVAMWAAVSDHLLIANRMYEDSELGGDRQPLLPDLHAGLASLFQAHSARCDWALGWRTEAAPIVPTAADVLGLTAALQYLAQLSANNNQQAAP